MEDNQPMESVEDNNQPTEQPNIETSEQEPAKEAKLEGKQVEEEQKSG